MLLPTLRPIGIVCRVVLVFAGFLTGPIAWALAMMASYGFASRWCFPGSQRLTGPMVGWGGVSVLIPVLYIAAIVVTAAAAAISPTARGR